EVEGDIHGGDRQKAHGVDKGNQTQRQGGQGKESGGGEFAGHDLPARQRIDQQWLERLALALAGGGVDGHVHRAHEQRDQYEIRQERQHDVAAWLGRGQILVRDVDWPGDFRVYAAQLQPKLAALLAVSVEVGAHPTYRVAGIAPGLVGDDFYRRRPAGLP